MRSAGTTGLRSFQETNSSECRIRCTTQVWMIVSGEILQSLDLIALEPAKLLAPAVVRDLRNPNRAYRFGNALPLRHQHIHLAQLRNNLRGLVSLPRHRGPPWLDVTPRSLRPCSLSGPCRLSPAGRHRLMRRHGPALAMRPGGLGRRRDRGRAGVRPRASNSVTSAPSQNSVSRPVAVACGTSFLCRGRVSWSMLRVGGPTASLEAFKCRSLRPKAWRLPLARDCDACHTISEALGPSKLTRVDTWRLCCESVTRSPAISRFSLPGALCAYAALVGI